MTAVLDPSGRARPLRKRPPARRGTHGQPGRARPGETPVRVGVTGHIHLTTRSRRLIYAALVGVLHEWGPRVHGVTCLADGADQLFAEALLAAGCGYDVVLPAPDYREREVTPENRAAFDRLLLRARCVHHASTRSGTRAYAAAGELVLDRSDRLLAVWDGTGGDVGSTASIVAAARRRGIPVTVIWPPGARRTVRSGGGA